MNKGSSDTKGSSKPVQKSLMSHFFGQKPSKPVTVEIDERKQPEVVVIDSPVSKESNTVEVIEVIVEKEEPKEVEKAEDVKEATVESPSPSSAKVVTPSPPAAPEAPTGRRSSRIAHNAEVYAKAYYEALENAPGTLSMHLSTELIFALESPPRKSKRSSEDSDDEDDRKRKSSKSATSSSKTSSFFLSNVGHRVVGNNYINIFPYFRKISSPLKRRNAWRRFVWSRRGWIDLRLRDKLSF